MSGSLAPELARFVYGVRFAEGAASNAAKTLLLDALAVTLSGIDSDAAVESRRVMGASSAGGGATLFGAREKAAPEVAAFVHGAALRYLDLMDYYVAADVSHPSEVIPVILAYAEAAKASGSETLACIVAGVMAHIALTETVPLHSIGLHHVGHAAIVVPLVVSRLKGLSENEAAMALSISAARFFVPEGFAKGHLAKVKALAYPLLARQAAEATTWAARGFAGSPKVLEEVFGMLDERFGAPVSAEAFLSALHGADLRGVLLKAYPAQYTLQGLIAAAATAGAAEPFLHRRVRRIEVHSSARSIERTADAAKFKPASREAADHSLPFCVAIALMEGRMGEDQIACDRWKDEDLLSLMARIEPHALPGELGFGSGAQSMVLHLEDGSSRTIDCPYPPADVPQSTVALAKLRHHGQGRIDAERVAATVRTLESLNDVSMLCEMLG